MPRIKWFPFTLILAILGFTLYSIFPLVHTEWTKGNICPKILRIPACYIVMGFFLLAFIAQLIPFKKSKLLFFIGIGINCSIALVGTIGQLSGLTECPKTTGGIPMCFISLGICLSLLVLKLFQIRLHASRN